MSFFSEHPTGFSIQRDQLLGRAVVFRAFDPEIATHESLRRSTCTQCVDESVFEGSKHPAGLGVESEDIAWRDVRT